MIKLCFPNEEPNLVTSWKIIKEAVQLLIEKKQSE